MVEKLAFWDETARPQLEQSLRERDSLSLARTLCERMVAIVQGPARVFDVQTEVIHHIAGILELSPTAFAPLRGVLHRLYRGLFSRETRALAVVHFFDEIGADPAKLFGESDIPALAQPVATAVPTAPSRDVEEIREAIEVVEEVAEGDKENSNVPEEKTTDKRRKYDRLSPPTIPEGMTINWESQIGKVYALYYGYDKNTGKFSPNIEISTKDIATQMGISRTQVSTILGQIANKIERFNQRKAIAPVEAPTGWATRKAPEKYREPKESKRKIPKKYNPFNPTLIPEGMDIDWTTKTSRIYCLFYGYDPEVDVYCPGEFIRLADVAKQIGISNNGASPLLGQFLGKINRFKSGELKIRAPWGSRTGRARIAPATPERKPLEKPVQYAPVSGSAEKPDMAEWVQILASEKNREKAEAWEMFQGFDRVTGEFSGPQHDTTAIDKKTHLGATAIRAAIMGFNTRFTRLFPGVQIRGIMGNPIVPRVAPPSQTKIVAPLAKPAKSGTPSPQAQHIESIAREIETGKKPKKEPPALSNPLNKLTVTALLTPEQEINLAALIKDGDRSARDQMILANMRLVISIANDYKNFGLPHYDLVAEGAIGLTKAVERFDPEKGGKLSTYAAWWIKQSIRRALSNQTRDVRIPVHMADKIRKMNRISLTMTEEFGREPTDEELAEEMGIRREVIANWKTNALGTVSLDAPMGEDNDTDRHSLIASDGPTAGEVVGNAEMYTELFAVMEQAEVLDEREKKIINLRFGLNGNKPQTLDEVGEELGVTRERIRQLQNKALGKLKRALLRRDNQGLQKRLSNLKKGEKGAPKTKHDDWREGEEDISFG